MNNLVSIGMAAKILGVSEITLRRWDCEEIFPAIKTEGGRRRCGISKLKPETVHKCDFAGTRKTIAHARVSSRSQKSDLERRSYSAQRMAGCLI
jgi:predicted site-specific integrase-resolvase